MDAEILKRIAEEQEKLWKELEEDQRKKAERGELKNILEQEYDSPLFWDSVDDEKIAKNETAQALQAFVNSEDDPDETAENFKVRDYFVMLIILQPICNLTIIMYNFLCTCTIIYTPHMAPTEPRQQTTSKTRKQIRTRRLHLLLPWTWS